MSFATQLRNYRTSHDMTLDELAVKLGTSRQVLSRYERGDFAPKITKVKMWADILGVPVEYFVESVARPEAAVEGELLFGFRKLNSDGQRAVLDLVKYLSETQKS